VDGETPPLPQGGVRGMSPRAPPRGGGVWTGSSLRTKSDQMEPVLSHKLPPYDRGGTSLLVEKEGEVQWIDSCCALSLTSSSRSERINTPLIEKGGEPPPIGGGAL
jgi:hypothetical protein